MRLKSDYIPFMVYRDIGMSRIRSVRWGVPVREDICPGPSAL